MIIHLATDHAGFEHKEAVLVWLKQEGYEIVDHGTNMPNELDDFPDFIGVAAKAVSDNSNSSKGIIFGGSGQGEAMLANRYPKIRCAVFYGGDENVVLLSRQHNDSNVLSIGARFVDINTTKRVIWSWLHIEALADEKYSRRNKKIERLTDSLSA